MKVLCALLPCLTICEAFNSHQRLVVSQLAYGRQRRISRCNSNINRSRCVQTVIHAKVGEYEDTSDLSEVVVKPNRTLGGVEVSPELVAILTVYFVQGALGLSRLAVSFFMKDELHLSPTDMAAIGGITSLPWLIKPLYGFLSDGIPIFGYKRRSYLIIAGIFGCLSWLALGTIVTDATSAVAAITLGSASVAVSDVVADSIVVEKSRMITNEISSGSDITSTSTSEQNILTSTTIDTTMNIDNNSNNNEIYTTDIQTIQNIESVPESVAAGALQSLCWSAAAIGGILSAYFSGSLLQTVTPRIVFCLTAFFPLLISAVSFLIDEKPENFQPSIKEFTSTVTEKFVSLKETLINPKLYLPVLFIFCWQATPQPDSAMFFFTTGELGFQPEFLGKVRLAASLAALAGVTIYRTFLKDISIKQVILWTSLISVPLSLTQLMLVTHFNRVIGIPDQLFALTDTVVLTVLGQIAFMPTLVLASTLCPPGIEGTLFATLMSIYNAAGTLASELGALLTSYLHITDKNFDNLPNLVLICSLTSLLPLPFINVLDNTINKDINSTEIEIENNKIIE